MSSIQDNHDNLRIIGSVLESKYSGFLPVFLIYIGVKEKLVSPSSALPASGIVGRCWI